VSVIQWYIFIIVIFNWWCIYEVVGCQAALAKKTGPYPAPFKNQ